MSYQKHNFTPGAVLFASELNDMDNQIEFLSNQESSLSDDFKNALLNCFENVAWVNENGQIYYDALYNSLYPDNMWFITNVLTGCITSNNSVNILKNSSYVATITANQGYTLNGATVNILMGGNDVTNLYYSSGSINIPNVTGDLVITVNAVSDVSSISAVFTQGQNVIYTNDSLEVLREYLVVTAIYADSSTQTVTSYTLSGMLGEGTQTITVSYGGKTDTFTVICTVKGFLYHFNQSLLSSGTKDFGWSGPENYSTGYDGSGYSYEHAIIDGVDQGSIKAVNLSQSQMPDLSSDFTISCWSKADADNFNLAVISNIKYNTTAGAGGTSNALSSVQDLADGWTFSAGVALSARYKGIRFQSLSGALCLDLWPTDSTNRAGVRLTPPSSFSVRQWHHFAVTRKSGIVRIFVDGLLICRFTYSKSIFFNTQITTAANFKSDADNPSDLIQYVANVYEDDLFIADYCKWDSEFNPSEIIY